MADKKRTVKVAVYMVLEVNVDELEAEYGHEFTNAEARQDAWDTVMNAAQNFCYPEDAMRRGVVEVVKTNARPQVADR